MASILSFSVPKINIPKASLATPSTTTSPPENLDQKYGRKGIKFIDSGDVPMVELQVRNGSSVKLQIPNALVTSYKPKVYWKDDGFEEVLYTLPANDSSNTNSKGGIGLVVNEVIEQSTKGSALGRSKGNEPAPVKASEWIVADADSDSIDAVQVELSCTRGSLELSYVVSLYPLSMATAVIIKNNGRKSVSLNSGILTHFRSKTKNGTGIQGLKKCSYCTQPPPSSPFEILSPSEALKIEEPGLFSFGWEPEKKRGEWVVQDVPITVLEHKLSRVYGAPPEERLKGFYQSTPSKYDFIDQGRELFFRVIRMGYDDIYVSSPGSISQKYGDDYFVCTGPASLVEPIVLNPGEEWRGAQIIEHDNL